MGCKEHTWFNKYIIFQDCLNTFDYFKGSFNTCFWIINEFLRIHAQNKIILNIPKNYVCVFFHNFLDIYMLKKLRCWIWM
jgi:hypothetical protein